MSKFFFISGLPRSGSTLLSAILRQNPRISAGVTSPVFGMVRAMQRSMMDSEFVGCFDEDRRARLVRGIFEAYYASADEGVFSPVIFDTNRRWTGCLPLLAHLFPDSRVLCCVRDLPCIVDSIERMLDRNPLQVSKIFRNSSAGTIYERAQTILNNESGLIGAPLLDIKEAWFGPFSSRLVLIDYDKIASDPQYVLDAIYDEIGEPKFVHDFNDIQFDSSEYDDLLGMPGLHFVRKSVQKNQRKIQLPPDLIQSLKGHDFWTLPENNVNDVLVL